MSSRNAQNTPAVPQLVPVTHHMADPIAFARERLDFHPDDTQALVLDPRVPRGILNCCRQWGKSTTVAVLAVWRAFHFPGSLIIVAGPTARQSGEFIFKAAGLLRLLGIQPRGDGYNKISLLLPNGSRLIGIPGNEGGIRGFSRVDLLLIDEAARVRDELYLALRPMLATSERGAIWLLSTPFGRRGFFYDEWVNAEANWTRIHAPATACPRINPEYLAEERLHHTDQNFRQEYLCEFVAADHAYFDPDAVADAFRKRPAHPASAPVGTSPPSPMPTPLTTHSPPPEPRA